MAYLAFYRTFRPTTFDNVVRQEHIVKILKNQITTNKVGHAYLFCGPRGTGKTTLAKIFARAINCENPKDGSPCGVCPTCKALANSANLDISEIDAASNNGVDEMRDLREKVQYPPVSGKYKVYIIDEVHMLTASAFNAVLKTLEEPPHHAVFILATTEPQKIPATILSRCMRFDFKLIPQADLEGLIKDVFDKTGKKYESEAISAIARAGAGSARDSLSIADMCASYSQGKLSYNDVNSVLGSADFESICDIVKSVFEQDSATALQLTESVISTGKGIGVLIKDMLTFLNNCAIVKMCRNAQEILNVPTERYNKIKSVADVADGHKILRVTEVLSKAESDMRYALNGRITLETALLKCAMPDSDYNIDALMGRIALLEKKLEEGVKVQVSQMPQASAQVRQTAQSTQQAQPFQQYQQNQQDGDSLSEQVKAFRSEKNKRSKAEVDQLVEPIFDDAPIFDDVPPEFEQYTADNSYGDIPARKDKKTENKTVGQSSQQTVWEQPQVIANAPKGGSLTDADKRQAFGKFIKTIRETRRNAVLFTLCQDLDSKFEGDKFILSTPTEAIYKSLNREDNAKAVADALATIGVLSYEVRLVNGEEDKMDTAFKKLKDNFKGTDIQIK